MAAKIRLIEFVPVEEGRQRRVECALTPAGVTVSLAWHGDDQDHTLQERDISWDEIDNLDLVSELFDLETVRVFRIVAQLLGQARNLRSCL